MALPFWLIRIGPMLPRRLSFFLAISLMLPTYQVVNPQRDLNAEENVALNFLRIRHSAGLPPLRRAEGSAFSRAACQVAEHGSTDKVWAEDATYAAVMYSSAKPESADAVTQLATRSWPADRRLFVGACAASTPAFPSGHYWIAIGVLGATSDRSVAELLSGAPLPNATPHSGE